MLANPPFMTPKGGIKPHKRFSVQAKRSEVLFVDYILEHLRPNGRAGIIVPEGIIFKSGTAYKALRKLLVEDGLICCCLTAIRCIQPLCRSKTSILLFDKTLAKKTNGLLFIKIQNDGYDLGAQRRQIDKNDLPLALEIIRKYKSDLKNGESYKLNEEEKQIALLVSKEIIALNSEYILTGDRYKETVAFVNQKYSLVELGDIAEVISGQSPEGKYYNSEGKGLPFYQGKTEFGDIYLREPKSWTTQITRVAERGDILLSVRAPVGPVNISTQKICIGRGLASIKPKKIEQMFLFYCLRAIEGNIKGSGGAVFDSINKKQIEEIKIPLPPIEIQKEIIEQIETKQQVIDSAKVVIKNLRREKYYFGRSLKKLKDANWMEIGSICKLINGRAFKPSDWEKKEGGGLPIIRIQNLNNSNAEFNYYSGYVDPKITINRGDLLFSWSGSRGTSFGAHIWNGDKAILNQHIFKVEHKKEINRKYLYLVLNDAVSEVEENLHGGVGLVHITKGNLEKIKVPIPSSETQEKIVCEFEEQEKIIETNQKLINIMEEKIDIILEDV
jgi:type I restriction enzyme M protein